MKIRITRIDPRASLPAYQTEGAAGFDLALIEEVMIPPKTAVLSVFAQSPIARLR